LERAKEAANGLDIRIGGGVDTVRQYLRAGLIDEMHIAMAPFFLGSGESLFSGIDMRALGYQCAEHTSTPSATHMIFKRGCRCRHSAIAVIDPDSDVIGDAQVEVQRPP